MRSIAAMVVMALFGVALLADDRPTRYPWLSDLDQARAIARETGRPLLIAFRCEP